MPNCKTVNAVKLTTNVFHDIHITFVNEFVFLFEKEDFQIIHVNLFHYVLLIQESTKNSVFSKLILFNYDGTLFVIIIYFHFYTIHHFQMRNYKSL